MDIFRLDARFILRVLSGDYGFVPRTLGSDDDPSTC